MILAETIDFEGMRHAMVVSQLRTSAVDDARVVEAMAKVEREHFVPDAHKSFAYYDRDLPLANGRAMNAPLATGRLIVEARVGAGDKVLLVGAANGYAAAVLARLAGSVVALEEDAVLVARARELLGNHTNVRVVEGALNAGWADGAPYDAIIIDGAVQEVPEAIVSQVRVDGHITTGIVDRGVSRLASGRRSEGGFGLLDFADIDCVVLPGFSKPTTFRF